MEEKEKLYQKQWLMWLLLVLTPPVGIVLMWITKKDFTTIKKVVITSISLVVWLIVSTVFLFFWLIVSIVVSGTPKTTAIKPNVDTVIEAPTEEVEKNVVEEHEKVVEEATEIEEPKVEEPKVEEPKVTEDQEKVAEEEPIEEKPGVTLGQINALSAAIRYLSFTSFSYSGLINQLEFEGYTVEDATYAVDNCGADWNEQAEKKANSYLEFTSFSKEGLIKQLTFEGFTAEQAEYGATAVGY